MKTRTKGLVAVMMLLGMTVLLLSVAFAGTASWIEYDSVGHPYTEKITVDYNSTLVFNTSKNATAEMSVSGANSDTLFVHISLYAMSGNDPKKSAFVGGPKSVTTSIKKFKKSYSTKALFSSYYFQDSERWNHD